MLKIYEIFNVTNVTKLGAKGMINFDDLISTSKIILFVFSSM